MRALEEAAQSADCGLGFKGGTARWNHDMRVPIVTDASWAGEDDVVKGRIESRRSQKARFNGLAWPGFIEGNNDNVRPM
eukprot:3922178-Pyramimonas_sp.AAC.1